MIGPDAKPVECPACGREIIAHANGRLRTHAPPRAEGERGGKRCEGSGKRPEEMTKEGSR